MSEIMKIVLSLSLSGSLLILVIFLCKPLIKNKISKSWQYYIWLVVIARLLLPFSPETSFVGTLFQELDRSVVVQTGLVSTTGQGIAPMPQPETDTVTGGEQGGELVKSDTPPSQAILSATFQNLWSVWLVVALILLIRKMTIYQGFARYVKAGRAEVSDTAILDQLALIGEQAGVKTPVELYTNSLIASPLLLGFFRPSIVLPTTDVSESDLQYILLHELTHYKRRDMFYKWLVQLTICLHWFNPLAYLMGREISRACELACDEAVIRKLDTKGQRDYGDTLLGAIVMGGDYRDSLASMTLNESKELLKERLEAIMDFKRKTKLAVTLSIAFVFFLCFGAVAAGAYTGGKIITSTNGSAAGENMIPVQNDEYSMTVYINGQDISQEIIRLWYSANNIYNVDDNATFQMGNAVSLFETAPEFIELLNYDQEVDAVFTANGKAQLEQTKIGGDLNLIQKQGDLIYRMGSWKTGYSYSEALDGMKILEEDGDILTLEVKYKQPSGLGDPPTFDYAKFTVKKTADQWYVENYIYPEAYTGAETKSSGQQEKHGGQAPAVSFNTKTDVIKLTSDGQKSIMESGSFESGENQKLIFTIQSNIKGGTVDLFLFSPTGQEQHITIDGSDKTETVALTAGRWAYNCTGFFDSGEVAIKGQLSVLEKNAESQLVQLSPSAASRTGAADSKSKPADFVISVESENVIVKQGGTAFKLEVDPASQNNYTIRDNTNVPMNERNYRFNKWDIVIERKKELGTSVLFSSTVTLTIPENLERPALYVQTASGDIHIENLHNVNLAVKSESGNVYGTNTSTDYISAESDKGNIKLTNVTSTGDIEIRSDTGSVAVKLGDSSNQYSIKVHTEPKSPIMINGKNYVGGDYTIGDGGKQTITLNGRNNIFSLSNVRLSKEGVSYWTETEFTRFMQEQIQAYKKLQSNGDISQAEYDVYISTNEVILKSIQNGEKVSKFATGNIENGIGTEKLAVNTLKTV